MAIGFVQGFGLLGAGVLAGISLFIWFADRVSQSYGEIDPMSRWMTTLIVSVLMFGCFFLLWLVISHS